jgi:hypothetical protein
MEPMIPLGMATSTASMWLYLQLFICILLRALSSTFLAFFISIQCYTSMAILCQSFTRPNKLAQISVCSKQPAIIL